MTSDIKTFKKGSFKCASGVLTIGIVSKSVDVEAVFSGAQPLNLPRQLHGSRLVLRDEGNTTHHTRKHNTGRIKQVHLWLTQQSNGENNGQKQEVRVEKSPFLNADGV